MTLRARSGRELRVGTRVWLRTPVRFIDAANCTVIALYGDDTPVPSVAVQDRDGCTAIVNAVNVEVLR